MQFGDIDYMIRQKDFTYDPVNYKGLPEFVQSIKKDGLRYIIILVSELLIERIYPFYLKEFVLARRGKLSTFKVKINSFKNLYFRLELNLSRAYSLQHYMLVLAL